MSDDKSFIADFSDNAVQCKFVCTMTTKLYFQLFALYHECAFDIIFIRWFENFGSDSQIFF